MPTVADLDRLRALLTRLAPIAPVGPGQLIRADDWNLLVDAVLDLARVVMAAEDAGGVPDHEHVDQVRIGWLEPSLRALVERGGLADPAVDARVRDMDRRLGDALTRTERVRQELDRVRHSVVDVETRTIRGEGRGVDLQRKLDQRENVVEDVRSLRETLGSLQTGLRTALDVANTLTVEGQAVDVGALVGKVSELEQIRERLTGASGELLDAAAIERRLTELTTTLVTQDTLNSVIAERIKAIRDVQLGQVASEVEAVVLGQLDQRVIQQRTELLAAMDARLGGLDEKIVRGLADATPALTERLLGTLRDDLDARLVTARAEDAGAFDERLRATRAEVIEEVDQRAAGLREQLREALTEDVRGAIGGEIGTLREEIGAAASAAATAQEHAAAARAESADLAARVAPAADALARLDAISARVDEFDKALDVRLAEVVQTTTLNLEGRLDQLIDARIGDVRNNIVEVVTRDFDARTNSLLEELGSVRTELGTLETHINHSERVLRTELERRLGGRPPG